MSCYVDPLFHMPSRQRQAFAVGVRHGHLWSHLWADTLEELHHIARRVGMRREWFQEKPGFPHYDLVPPRRAAAIRAGALVVTISEWRRSPLIVCPDCGREVSECGTIITLGDFRECGVCHVGSQRDEWKTLGEVNSGPTRTIPRIKGFE